MEGVNVIRTAVIKTCKLQFPYKNPNLLGHDKMHGRKGEKCLKGSLQLALGKSFHMPVQLLQV